jgi:3-methyladenine DNA glycosylase/8-oxoguanine DNA glycosylase
LSRLERLPDGLVVRMEMTAEPHGVRLVTDATGLHLPLLEERTRWILALDEQFDGFHALCRGVPGLHEAAARGSGRILRCPTVWEDLVKTLFSVNTTWRQTVAMTRSLVDLCGAPHDGGGRAFPEPDEVAAAGVDLLKERCRVGYRGAALSEIARRAAGGQLSLEALTDSALPDAEIERRLRELPGIGPYAAANVMMLLGRYDHLPVDSWFRKTVRDAWFAGKAVPDSELVAAFDRFRPYRTLVYRFYDWEGAMRTGVWTG